MPPEPVLHLEGFAPVKRFGVSFQAGAKIFGVDIFRPTVSQFCVNGATRESQPRLIEICAKLVRTRHPDHHGSGVRYQPETLFTLAQGSLCLLAKSDVPDDYGKHFPPVGFCVRNRRFDGEFLSRYSQTTQRFQITHCLGTASFTEMKGLCTPCVPEPLRDEPMNQSPDRIAGPTCEHFF